MVPDRNRIQFGRESSAVIPDARICAAGSEPPKSAIVETGCHPLHFGVPLGNEQESRSQWNDLFVKGGTAKATRTRFLVCYVLLMLALGIGCVFLSDRN